MSARRRVQATGCALLALWLLACASGPVDQAPGDRAAVDLGLTSADGQRVRLSQWRGQPLLVFVFATYDDVCQLALSVLELTLPQHPELNALGIAAQPDAQALLPLYRDALSVSFPLAYDPHNRVVSQPTDLGALDTVPTYVLLDAQGHVLSRHVGALGEAELEAFLQPAATDD